MSFFFIIFAANSILISRHYGKRAQQPCNHMFLLLIAYFCIIFVSHWIPTCRCCKRRPRTFTLYFSSSLSSFLSRLPFLLYSAFSFFIYIFLPSSLMCLTGNRRTFTLKFRVFVFLSFVSCLSFLIFSLYFYIDSVFSYSSFEALKRDRENLYIIFPSSLFSLLIIVSFLAPPLFFHCYRIF